MDLFFKNTLKIPPQSNFFQDWGGFHANFCYSEK